jgi:DHA1 family bicyclomycin/chloramphenicol resistance-like MFS transporter
MARKPPGIDAVGASSGAPTARRTAAPLPLLILVAVVTPIAMNMYLPAMAEMQRDLGTSAAAIQLSLSLFLVATAVGQLFVGPVSDLIGRRPALLWGLAIFAVGTVVCALAPNVETLVVGRIVQGLGGCAGLVLARAIIRDLHGAGAAASMIAYVTMGMAVGPLVTPPVGGVVADLADWRLIFWIMLAYGLVAFAFSLARMEETHAPGPGHGVFRRYVSELGALLRLREFWLYAGTLGAVCIAFFSFIAGGVFVATEAFDLTASEYGLFFIINVVGYVVGNFITGRLARRIGPVPMIMWGNVITLAALVGAVVLGVAGVVHPLSLFGPLFLVGVGNGLSLPNCVAGAVSVRPQLAGSASGLVGAFQIGSGALASLLVGLVIDLPLWDGTRWPVLVPMTAGAILALGLGFLLKRRV